MFKNKNAQSSLIIAVIIIFIAIIAIVLFWNIFNLKKESKEININAIQNEIEIKEAGLFLTGASRVNVQRKSGNGSIESLKFIFFDLGGKTHTEIINDNIPRLLETNSYFFSPFEDISKIRKISVYPVVNGKEGAGSSIDSNQMMNIPAGLVSWWKFDNNLIDSIGKNNGQIIGDVKFIEDEGNKAVGFNSGYIDFGNDFSLGTNKEFTLAFSIKSNSKQAEILRKGTLNSNYKINLSDKGRVFFSYSSNGNVKSYETIKNIGDGKWHYLIITNMAIYIDGEIDRVLNINDRMDINNEELIVGEGFDGYLGNLMFFNSSVDKSQAWGIYNSYS